MKPWKRTCREFKGVRKAIEDENSTLIISQLIAICDKYAKEKWNFAEDYERMAEDLREVDAEELDGEDVDFYLHDFYDLCDSARVWLDI